MSAKPNMIPAGKRCVDEADAAHPLRAISFGNPAVTIDRRDDGTIYLRPKIALGDYPVRITDRLHHWASRGAEPHLHGGARAGGGWRKITYAQLLASSRRIASALAGARSVAPKSRSSFSPAIPSIMR